MVAGKANAADIMTHRIDDIALPHGRPGTVRHIRIHRFGQEGARPKAYIQAGLHAGELPGMLVAQHLAEKLASLDAAGAIRGEIVLVPMANPIGLDQVLHGDLSGRFELAGGVNFNRAFADLSGPAGDMLAAGQPAPLGSDAQVNAGLVRAALAAAAISLSPRTQADGLRQILLSHAIDADLVLDLHCDSEAVMHLYTTSAGWGGGFADLAARLGCEAAFLAEGSGGEPFDEACSLPWQNLQARFAPAGHPIPDGCAATTVELRGEGDVDDMLAAADAKALLDHLSWRGHLALSAPPVETALDLATPLAGVERIRAPVGGIVLFHVEPGQSVRAGQPVATVLEPLSGKRHVCQAGIDGPVWSRSRARYASPDDIILSIAGREPLATGSHLLTAR
ncbi:M14 family metallopeptidase [Niveispirillum irakense]|uniref:M14 family metallopeptidase n=1 Tax=Niveispirillum irakense TaxID=34011 RepID=UPI000418B970|nr:M14 family metallopeptidase [Niveispirillum irakense]